MPESWGNSAVTASGIDALKATAGKFFADSERERNLHPEVVEKILCAGFARHFVPHEHGGTQGSFGELARALVSVCPSDASAAWCALIFATSGRMAAFLPAAGRAQVWRDGPDTAISAALSPAGRAKPMNGGWRLTGEWNLVSGADHSDWALLCVAAPTQRGAQLRFMAVPRSAYRVRDTWFNVGMRGTGSNTIVVDGAFVPDELSFTREALAAGAHADVPGACYRVPLQSVSGLPFAALCLGIARGALDRWSEWTADQRIAGSPMRDHEAARLVYARSAVELEAAQLLVERAAGAADDMARAEEFGMRNARDMAQVAEVSRAVVDRLFDFAGAQAQREDDPLQRAWRDVHTASSHVVLRFTHHGCEYARQAWTDAAA
ncbi:acyl-CoA dehydrogenase family protein [Streptomyces platensis]|uniref:acyl-CoA dehydrogenase family protein n=1 Tax=Streptomyces platensis TaxID=58346 RepID=UPI00332ED22D